MTRRIFISAVSRELLSYRTKVAQWLQKRGYIPVFQDIWPLTDQKIDQLLRDKLEPCDAVICLIGFRYGAEPSTPLADQPRRSFTQLEYFFARDLAKPAYLFLTTDGTPIDHSNDEDEKLRTLQHDYRREATRDRNWRQFSSETELRAEIAELQFPWDEGPRERKPCNLPPSIGTLFKGRDDFLTDLRAKLCEAGVKAAAITPRQAIHGLGGVGKTRLAIEFGWRHFDDYHALLYLYAENPSTLLTNLAQLTGVLELPERDLREDEKRADAVIHWLSTHRDWLLLIDNVDTDEAATEVIKRLQNVHGGHIVITSRLSRWPRHFKALELDVLDKPAAVAFLLEAAGGRTDANDDAAQAELICDNVDGLALALTQAAGYIDKYRISFAEYRKRWQENVAKVAAWHDPKTMDYPRSLAVTWNTTVDRLTPPARTLLELLSFLAPEPIPRDLITDATSSADALARVGIVAPEEALVELADMSLLKLSRDSMLIHRLVQEISRGRIAVDQSDDRLKAAIAIVDEYPLGNPCDVREWPRWLRMEQHIGALLDRAVITRVSLMNGLGVFLNQRRRFSESVRFLRRAVYLCETFLGKEDLWLATSLSNLACLLRDLNRFAEAESLLRRSLGILEKCLGTQHPEVAYCLHNLARLLHDMNRLAEAETLIRRALSILELLSEGDNRFLTAALGNLGSLLRQTNRSSDAESVLRRAVKLSEDTSGRDHPSVANNLRELAELLLDTNRADEAEPMLRRAFAIDEKCFGPDEPFVARGAYALASCLVQASQFPEAETLIRRALAMDEASLAAGHPQVASDLNLLANVFCATDRVHEAEPLMRRALAIYEASFGADHPNVARNLSNLAHLLYATNRLADAEPLMRRALVLDEQNVGPEHPLVATDLDLLAAMLQDMHRPADAEPLMRRLLAVDENNLGPEHPNVPTDLNNLALLLQDMNRAGEAEPLMRRAAALTVDSWRRTGNKHPDLAKYLENYKYLLATMGRSEAETDAAVQQILEGTPEST